MAVQIDCRLDVPVSDEYKLVLQLDIRGAFSVRLLRCADEDQKAHFVTPVLVVRARDLAELVRLEETQIFDEPPIAILLLQRNAWFFFDEEPIGTMPAAEFAESVAAFFAHPNVREKQSLSRPRRSRI